MVPSRNFFGQKRVGRTRATLELPKQMAYCSFICQSSSIKLTYFVGSAKLHASKSLRVLLICTSVKITELFCLGEGMGLFLMNNVGDV